MLRNKLQKINPKENDIIFQITDWKAYDLIYFKDEDDDDDDDEDADSDNENNNQMYKKKIKRLIIRGYGVTNHGNSICVQIKKFQPFFYFKIPENWDKNIFNEFKKNIINLVGKFHKKSLIKAEIILSKDFYGFTNNELFQFGLFVFENQSAYYEYLKILKEYTDFDIKDKLYETKVSSLLRFYHIQNIDPSRWLTVKANQYKMTLPKFTRTQIDITTDYTNISNIHCNDIPKIITASFDIECTSSDGSFPKFNRQSDQIIQIGVTVYVFGDNDCKLQYIATLKNCDSIENTMVESYQNEKDLILGWANFIVKLDPDILTGYNIWGFDWEYIYRRAELGMGDINNEPYHDILVRKLQRIDSIRSNLYKIDLTIKDLSSSALGVNILKFIDIEGIVQIDLLKVVQRDYKLESYKLNEVAKYFMKQQKIDLSPKEIFKNYKDGTPDKIKEIAVYCIMDCKLVNDLINKLQVITNNLGMSNVCIVPFSYLFLRGQGIKIFSLVAKFCREENFLIKDLLDSDIDKNSYEGAIVFVPEPSIHFEPIVVMDYNSLYPSSMISENISHDSIVGYKEYTLQKNNEYILTKNTINEKYDNLPDYNYNDIEYDIFQGIKEDKKKIGYKVCKFAENKNGDKSVLPRILKKLLKARKDTRKMMEYKTFELIDGSIIEGVLMNDNDDEYTVFHLIHGNTNIEKDKVLNIKQTNNDFQLSVLDGLQNAYKVTCNSLYGQVGAATSSICYKELAACTTATGRNMVIKARDLTLHTFVGAKLTYGDSVTGDTPLLVKKNGFVNIVSIENLGYDFIPYHEFKPFDTNRKNKQQSSCDYQIWTNDGWANIHRIIRHKTVKKIYRITTEIGSVDVTEDHSLLDSHKKIIKPLDCTIGTELLHNFPKDFPSYPYFNKSHLEMKTIIQDLYKGRLPKIPYEILNATQQNRIDFVKMFFENPMTLHQSEKIFYQSLYYLLKSVENDLIVNNIFDIYMNDFQNIFLRGNNQIKEIKYLYEINNDDGDYVYDIETSSGNFHAGIGQLIVKNTDSIFINFTDEIKSRYPEKSFTEKELLAESIKMGEEAAKNINKNMKAPQNIEYEKTFFPFCIFSKKRYFGNKYEHNIEKFKQTSMGIVLKRRDNAPIVKTIYAGVIDIILNKRNIEESKRFFYNSIKDLFDEKTDISQLIVSKTIKTDYSNPNQVSQKVLADRMTERDPGNKPQSNDRIPYCFIESCNLSCVVCNKKKISVDKSKCVNCMKIYCSDHLFNHLQTCIKICRFCKLNSQQTALNHCNTCKGWYCAICLQKHMIRKDKYKNVHNDKCKKPLTNKLLQGDLIEHPLYIAENNLKIDYKYYLSNQIEKPVYQIFELVMKNPKTIIEDLMRKIENTKSGNRTINDWIQLSKKKSSDNLNQNIPKKEDTIQNIKHILQTKEKNEEDNEDEDLLKDFFEEIDDDKNIDEEIENDIINDCDDNDCID